MSDARFWFGLAAVCVALYVALCAGAFAIDTATCRQAGAELHRATRYRVPAGCFIVSGDRFVPLDAYRVAAGDR